MVQDKYSVTVEEEIRKSYMDYAMSVIVGRALPDVRDGLKPVHRRALFSMHELRCTWQSAYKKSARIVGDVIGKYHPHGDQAVYDTMVRMAQDFSMRHPLIDGQGNFGSVDGDPPAAMRYTEVRLTRLAGELLADIEKETVDFAPNYDGSLEEPTVLPCRYPNLLVNGSSGIAVGMATNIPPHNMGEIIGATVALIGNSELTIDELMQFVPGPDFPTGAFIFGMEGIRDAYRTGRGLVRMRAKASIEINERTEREAIVVTELPFQVNKAKLVEKIAELVKDKEIDGISDLRDESDREGMRIVIELKRDAMAQVVLNSLFAHTNMQTTFGVINLAIVGGQPRVLNLKELLERFIDHRRDVITRRTIFELRKAEEKAHILEGYVKALDHLDEVIALIRGSATPEEARNGLVERFGFSVRQAQAILDLRLHRLTGMEREKILDEYREVLAEIERLKAILASEALLMDIIRTELLEVKAQFANPRRTHIVPQEGEIAIEDLIADEEMVVTISREGYIKRTPMAEYRAQRRGGKGKKGVVTKEEDLIRDLFVASSHTNLLIFTDFGKSYALKVYQVPMAGRNAKGKPIVNLIPTEKDERVRSILPIREFVEGASLLMVTKRGLVRRTDAMAFSRIRANGLIAIALNEGDDLIAVSQLQPTDDVILVTRKGMSIRFPVDSLRVLGRKTMGVKGMSLRDDDWVVGVSVISDPESSILSVTENGYGKRTAGSEYRTQSRGGLGLITIKTSERNGHVISVCQVTDDDEIMMVTTGGKIIRTRVKEVPVIGRNTQGVRLIGLDTDETVVAVERVLEPEEEDELGLSNQSMPSSRFHSAEALRQDEADAANDVAVPEEDAESDENPEA